MRVAIINEGDVAGNAFKIVFLLRDALMKRGVDTPVYVRLKRSEKPGVERLLFPMDPLSRIRRVVRRKRIEWAVGRYAKTRPAGCEAFTNSRTQYGADFVRALPQCDVLNLQFAWHMVDYEPFFSAVPGLTPVVWTLHDMSALTGGCHTAACSAKGFCRRFVDGCGFCPELGSRQEKDLSWRVWHDKRKALSRVDPARLSIVTPSHWLARLASQSSIFSRFPVHVIPNAVDLDAFRPRDRLEARSILGLPQHANIVLFIAQSLDNPRKGFGLLLEALKALSAVPNVHLVTVGSLVSQYEITVPHTHFTPMAMDGILSLVYSAADVFVSPTLMDNFPSVLLESMSCGIPAVAFDVGGVSEIIRNGVSGSIVPLGDVARMAQEIEGILSDANKKAKMAHASRRIATEEYSVAIQGKRYAELCESMFHDTR
jgi:glycosyltransferase involved in cell wall biosynthesis